MSQFYKKHRTKILILCIIISVSVIALNEYRNRIKYGSDNDNQTNKYEKTIAEYELNSKADFYTYNKNIYYCTKDGMQMLNSDGDIVWSDTYTMVSPYMTAEEDIIGVSDENGRILNIYNSKGKLYSINTENIIISFSINKNGFCSVISQNEKSYFIDVYNNNNEIAFKGEFPFEDGMPIASDISNDNKILAVSFLKINDLNMTDVISFYYISRQDGKTTESSDSMFSSFKEEDQIIPILKFMDSNNVIAVSDKAIICAGIKDISNNAESTKCEKKWSIELKNKLDCIDFPNGKYITVAYGEPFINKENSEKKGMVKWYNLEGGKSNEFIMDKTVTGLYSNNNATIIASDRNFKAVANKGGLIWEHNSIQDTKKILFLDGTNKVLFVTPKKAEIIDKSKKSNISNSDETEENSSDLTSETTTMEQETASMETTVQEETIETTTAKKSDENNKKEQNKDNKETTTKKQIDTTTETTTKEPEKPAETTTEEITKKNEESKEQTTEQVQETTSKKQDEQETKEIETEPPMEQNTQEYIPDPVMPE